ncbi:hypothetical protein [Pedobacter sp. B4-66]|uniref:hypothetical protein n=1 Tax=Pedobacter sp. B4-66 TaxID=2817280 RepID=UPI001BD964B8|nr:hypothetical protein [Pedobacter sp. B4-66]
MGNRPERQHRPLIGYLGDYDQEIKSIVLIRNIVSEALKQKLWVFDRSIKRWFTPEEFLEMYERYDNLDTKWLERIEILDPVTGLEAADKQIESILFRKAIFTKRIIEYMNKKK